ncbi:nitrous oxide reductase [Stipitochalara longipes BDJ]|nr:nitrous oxide reductase [Stipitochalara longipes BDJ]
MAPSIQFFITILAFISTVSAVSPPACQITAPSQETLNIQNANLTLQSTPFGIIYASEDIAFVGVGESFAILNSSTFPPTQISSSPADFGNKAYTVQGLAISHDKKTVYLSTGPGAIAIDVDKAVAGGADSVAGYLNGSIGATSIETTVSLHDHYVFVSQEDGSSVTGFNGAIEVFQVQRASNGSFSSTYVGYIELGHLVVGSALSPDGRRLYVTSEQLNHTAAQGTLSVLDVETLKTNPSAALLATADAGCGAVRVAVSHDGKHVWVTARESNMLLAFDAAKLESNSSGALIASVQVGTSPVGLHFVNHGRHIITADSNRFSYPNTTTGLTVVDVEAALNGTQGFPRIPTGLFPREIALSPDGKTLLVSDYSSNIVQAVNVTQLV